MTNRRKMELEQLDSYQVVKVDLDMTPPEEWLQDWIWTRKQIINTTGLYVTKVRMHPSRKGLHFWFHLNKPVDYNTEIKLQFLCGDDPHRVYFGIQRRGFTKFRSKFNILFNRKWPLDKEKK